MKKYLKFFAGFMLLAAFTSCQSKPSYTVKGQLPEGSENVEGTTIYLYDYFTKEFVDSTKVANNTFEFKNSVEKPQLAVFSVSPQQQIIFVLENGELTMDLDAMKVLGTPSNEAIATLTEKLTESNLILNAIRTDLDNSDLDDAVKAESWENEVNKYIGIMSGDLKAAYQGNENNPAGLYVLIQSRGLIEGDEYKEMLLAAGPDVQSAEIVQKQLTAIKAQDATAEGKMFTDFTANKLDGTEQHFSDVVGKGKYVLVDFWASWCGPCMREVPNLKANYAKYAGDNFEILGVAVWDKEEDSVAAAEKEAMPWKMMLNTDRVATDAYGITGIPQIILFAPDGTILKKNLRGDAIGETLKEIFGK